MVLRAVTEKKRDRLGCFERKDCKISLNTRGIIFLWVPKVVTPALILMMLQSIHLISKSWARTFYSLKSGVLFLILKGAGERSKSLFTYCSLLWKGNDFFCRFWGSLNIRVSSMRGPQVCPKLVEMHFAISSRESNRCAKCSYPMVLEKQQLIDNEMKTTTWNQSMEQLNINVLLPFS